MKFFIVMFWQYKAVLEVVCLSYKAKIYGLMLTNTQMNKQVNKMTI